MVQVVRQSAIPDHSLSLSLSLLKLVDLFGGRRLPWCGCHVAGVWLRQAHTLSVGGQEVNHYAGRVWWRSPCRSQLHLYNTYMVSDQSCHILISISHHCVISVLRQHNTNGLASLLVDFGREFIYWMYFWPFSLTLLRYVTVLNGKAIYGPDTGIAN